MLIRETWFFSGTGGTRWSEVLYKDASDLASATYGQGAALVNERLRLLSPHCSLQKIRYQTVVQPRVAKQVSYNLAGHETAGNSPANYTEAAVINIASTVASRRLWMRGLSEAAVSRNGTTGLDFADPAWITRLKEWLKGLKDASYIVLSRKKAVWQGDEPKKRKVTALAAHATAGLVILTLDPEMAMPDSKQVVIGGADARRFPGLNGVHDIVTMAGTALTMKYVLPDPAKIPGVGNMYAFRLEYQSVENMKISHLASSFGYLGGRQTKKLDTGSRGSRRVLRRVQ